jgi:hypothetical protein
MTSVRDMVRAMQVEMRKDDLPPSRAREILVQLSSLYGNCLDEVREADHAYAVVLLRFLDADEAATRAKIRAETSLEYLRKREADNTLRLVLESIRSLKVMLRSLEEEMRLTR